MILTERKRKKMILYSYTTPGGMWLGVPEKNVADRIRDYQERNGVTGVFGMLDENVYVPLRRERDLDALRFAVINNGEGETFSLVGLSILTEKELIANYILSAPEEEALTVQDLGAPASVTEAEDDHVSSDEEAEEDLEEQEKDFDEELPEGTYRCAWCHATFTDWDLEDPNCPAVVDYDGKDFCCFDHVSEFMFNGYAP